MQTFRRTACVFALKKKLDSYAAEALFEQPQCIDSIFMDDVQSS